VIKSICEIHENKLELTGAGSQASNLLKFEVSFTVKSYVFS